MIVLVGQVGSDVVDREAFQEIDYRRMYGSRRQVGRRRSTGPNGFPSTSRARTARRCPAGPDPSCWRSPRTCLPRGGRAPTLPRVEPVACGARRARRSGRGARAARRRAARPLVLVGGSRWDVDACAALRAFAEAQRAAGRLRVPPPGSVRQPPSALRRRRGHRHQSEARAPRIRDADVLLVDRRAAGRDDDLRLHAARRRRCRRRR